MVQVLPPGVGTLLPEPAPGLGCKIELQPWRGSHELYFRYGNHIPAFCILEPQSVPSGVMVIC